MPSTFQKIEQQFVDAFGRVGLHEMSGACDALDGIVFSIEGHRWPLEPGRARSPSGGMIVVRLHSVSPNISCTRMPGMA